MHQFSQIFRSLNLVKKYLERDKVKHLLKDSVVKSATTGRALQIVLGQKKGESLHSWVSARELNTIKTIFSYPILQLDGCIDSLGSSNVFRILDVNSGYLLIKLYGNIMEKTTIVTQNKLLGIDAHTFGWKIAFWRFRWDWTLNRSFEMTACLCSD